MKKDKKDHIIQFLKFIVEKDLGSLEEKEFWPLNPGQILSYFDLDFLLDVYARMNHLKNKGKGIEHVAKLFPSDLVLIDFLINFSCIGFKALEKFKLAQISMKERLEFFEFILQMIGAKDQAFLKEKNIRQCLSKKETDKIIGEKFIEVSDANRNIFNSFKVVMFGANWAFQYDLFAAYGWHFHGPYQVSYQGKTFLMTVDTYFDKRNIPHWPLSKKFPFDKAEIICLYEPFEYELNAYRMKAKENLGKKLRYASVVIDGKRIVEQEQLGKMISIISNLIDKQHEYVDKLTDLKKVCKAIEVVYYGYRKFLGKDWKRLRKEKVESAKKYGDRWILEKADDGKILTKKELCRKFDPTNDYF